MWINKRHFDSLIEDLKESRLLVGEMQSALDKHHTAVVEVRAQKAKDDMTIDWMRHRVNALEKQNAILLQKAAGVSLPVPEIVPTRPGTMTAPDFDHLPSFEDVGDAEAKRLGISTDDAGYLEFRADVRPRSE